MSNHQLGDLLVLGFVGYAVIVGVVIRVWLRGRRRHIQSPANMNADPQRWLRAQLPPLIAAEAYSLVGATFMWPLCLLDTDVGQIPYFNLTIGLFLAGIAALFIAIDVLLVRRARRAMRRQRAPMR